MARHVIEIGNVTARLVEGLDDLVDKCLAVPDPQAEHDPAYKAHIYDGLIRFFDRKSRTFPAGLYSRLQARLLKRGHEVELLWTDPGPDLDPLAGDMLEGIDLRDYQLSSGQQGLDYRRGILWLATNAGKTEIMSSILRRLVDAGMSAVVIVPNSNLLVQTAARIKKRLGDVRVGMAGDGRRELDADIVVATYQTLQQALPVASPRQRVAAGQKRAKVHSPELAALLRNAKAVLVDEAHHAASPVYRDILRLCTRATYRLGFTGTVDKQDRRGNLLPADSAAAKLYRYHLESFLGPVLARVTNAELIDRGVSAKPRIYVVSDRRGVGPVVPTPPPDRDAEGNILPGYNPYMTVFKRAVIQDDRYLQTVVEMAKAFIDHGLPPFCFSHSVDQLKTLHLAFREREVPADLLYGADTLDRRADVLREYVERQDRALLASSIFDEGADVPEIRAIFLVGARKSPIELLQRCGRGLRKKAGLNEILVVDFDPLHAPMLHDHCEARVAIYQHEGFPVRYIRDIAQLDAIFSAPAAGASPG